MNSNDDLASAWAALDAARQARAARLAHEAKVGYGIICALAVFGLAALAFWDLVGAGIMLGLIAILSAGMCWERSRYVAGPAERYLLDEVQRAAAQHQPSRFPPS